MKFRTALAILASTAECYAGGPKHLATINLPNACPGIVTTGEVEDGSGCYVLMVTFIGKHPSNAAADKACRAYLAKVPPRFHSQDILVTAWFRPNRSANPYDDDQIHPYFGHGADKSLIFEAKTGKVTLK